MLTASLCLIAVITTLVSIILIPAFVYFLYGTIELIKKYKERIANNIKDRFKIREWIRKPAFTVLTLCLILSWVTFAITSKKVDCDKDKVYQAIKNVIPKDVLTVIGCGCD